VQERRLTETIGYRLTIGKSYRFSANLQAYLNSELKSSESGSAHTHAATMGIQIKFDLYLTMSDNTRVGVD
jgi:hypothetical protein